MGFSKTETVGFFSDKTYKNRYQMFYPEWQEMYYNTELLNEGIKRTLEEIF